MKARETIDVEALVEWAYGRQQVDRVLGAIKARMKPGQPVSSTSVLVGMLELGCRVDSSGQGGAFAALSDGRAGVADDAITVHQAVCALPADTFGLVTMHGRRGTRPDWNPEGYGRMVAKRNRRGEMARLWADARNCRGWIGCELELVGTPPALVDFNRAEYRRWHAGLVSLAAKLKGTLEAHDVTGPRAPALPWAATRGQVLEDQRRDDRRAAAG